MNPKEKAIAAKLLQIARDEFADHGCNDLDSNFWDGWAHSEIVQFVREFHDYNGDPEQFDESHLHLPDYAVMGFMAHKLRLEAENEH